MACMLSKVPVPSLHIYGDKDEIRKVCVAVHDGMMKGVPTRLAMIRLWGRGRDGQGKQAHQVPWLCSMKAEGSDCIELCHSYLRSI
jgi:hypothetical protein